MVCMEPKVPNKTQMRHYLERGLTQQQIADEWEPDSGVRVSRSAIAMAIDRYGLKSAKPRARWDDLLPWRVVEAHRMHFDARMLRLEARRRRNLEISERNAKLLASWLRRLEEQNAVVTYAADTTEGFRWLARQESDGDSLIRH